MKSQELLTLATTTAAGDGDLEALNTLARSYYIFNLELALASIQNCRRLMAEDVVDENHELALIERLLQEAIQVS